MVQCLCALMTKAHVMMPKCSPGPTIKNDGAVGSDQSGGSKARVLIVQTSPLACAFVPPPPDGHSVSTFRCCRFQAEAFLMETENLHVVSLGDLGAYGRVRAQGARLFVV